MTPSKLRITILGLNYAPEPTGISPYTTRLAEKLVEEGHEITVITGFPHYPEWKLTEGYTGWRRVEFINGVRVKRVRHFIPSRLNNMHRLHMELSFGVRLLFTRWRNPDVLLVVSPALFSTAFVLARARFGFKRPATGIWVQDIYSRGLEETGNGGSRAAKVMKITEGAILRSATQVAVIHDRFKAYICRDLGVDPSKVNVIRNWTHVQPVVAVDRSATRARHGWNEDDIVVLHAGNIGVKQALENVVNAARLADATGSKVHFVLLGDGNQRRHIETLSSDVNRIQFISPLPDKEFREALASADILLVNEMAGLREMAVPSKLTSYFSTGLPVLAATEPDSTTAGEIEYSLGGIQIAPDSAELLLTSAEKLAANPTLATKLGTAGQNYAGNVLSQHAAILQYSEWLRELAVPK
ncbi:glycosyltransferase [Arthrobacter glacialis]|uniref:D-inositol 3-phosphate glycosyltransferase n=1 Tax=Arthrobacter glacialis TaxID=1664 RepID=A0A2S4A134_ARTGL|nr:glycosyltransferase [Arthrobacter glacialis]POH74902.1 glycosyltransferase WbuB [Arthrobacter glacialis]